MSNNTQVSICDNCSDEVKKVVFNHPYYQTATDKSSLSKGESFIFGSGRVSTVSYEIAPGIYEHVIEQIYSNSDIPPRHLQDLDRFKSHRRQMLIARLLSEQKAINSKELQVVIDRLVGLQEDTKYAPTRIVEFGPTDTLSWLFGMLKVA